MPPRNQGFALLIVLWSLVLIGMLITQIIAGGRSALALAGNVRAAAQGRAVADGGVQEAVFHLVIAGADHWQPDGILHTLNDAGLPVTVRVESLAGTINPNLASAALLAGLFEATGTPPDQARRIGKAITDWRSPAQTKQQELARQATYQRAGLHYSPSGHNFADLSELEAVDFMSPLLLAGALPYLSLYQSGEPNPLFAAPPVRQALMLSGDYRNINKTDPVTPVVFIQAVAGIPGRLTIRRQAFVSITGQTAAPFRILALTDGY